MNLPSLLRNLFKAESRGLERDRMALIAKMRKLYGFLETESGYTYSLIKETDRHPGGPVYYINKYTNLRAQRQVEIVLHRNSTPLHFYVKRMGKTEPAYTDNDNCYAFHEIDVYNGIRDNDRHNPYLEPDYEFGTVKTGLEIMRAIPGVLNGTEWFDREKLDRIYVEVYGFKSGHGDHPLFRMIKSAFAFLVEEHGFRIIHDYEKLCPFEQHLGGSVVYDNGNTTVQISVDLRDRDFAVYISDSRKYKPDRFWQTGEPACSGAVIEEELNRAAVQLNMVITSNA